jgi:hypothetical protein
MFAALLAVSASNCQAGVCLIPPPVSLSGFEADVGLHLPTLQPTGERWPEKCLVLVWSGSSSLELNTSIYANDTAVITFPVTPRSGRTSFQVHVLDDQNGSVLWDGAVALWSIPPWLSLLPPVLTVILALALRQVLFALLAGVWVGSLLVHQYNPLIAALRVLDTILPQVPRSNGVAFARLERCDVRCALTSSVPTNGPTAALDRRRLVAALTLSSLSSLCFSVE